MDIARDLFHAQQILMALFTVTNKLQMHGDKHLQDITIRQMLAIPALIHAPHGKATINHLARSMGTTKQSAKQIVDALERKGYLAVTPSDLDKRAVQVSITPEGQRAFFTCSERTDEFLADIFADFSTDDLANLCKLLQKLQHYDGLELGSDHDQMLYDESSSAEILRHHQNFARIRGSISAKETK